MAAYRRDDVHEYTREDLDRLTDALKNEEFRKLLVEYCEEMRSPEARETYRREMTQLEKERGYLVTFVSPSPGYAIKSSVDGDKKAFVNVCSSPEVGKPEYSRTPERRIEWKLPFSLAPPRDDYDKAMKRCVVYDVVFHPNTLTMASKISQFKEMLNSTALDAVENNHGVKLDRKNLKFPKLAYKGLAVPAVIRKPDPDFDRERPKDSFIDELYPQKSYSQPPEMPMRKLRVNNSSEDDCEYATPKYNIKHRRDIDMKEFTYERDAKKHSAIPTALVVEVNLPLLSRTADVSLDVSKKSFCLLSEKPAKYKLDLTLPYNVNDKEGSAKFDLAKRTLIVTLPVIPDETGSPWRHREDSGVESDMNSPCHSDEDNNHDINIAEDLSSSPGTEIISECEAYRTSDSFDDQFLDKSISYVIPAYLCHVFENVVVLTLEVKNVDSDSLVLNDDSDGDGIRIKFTSIGAGFFPIHYTLNFKLPTGSKCIKPVSEVWDNNVELQIVICKTELLDHVFIGSNDAMVRHDLEKSITRDDINGADKPNLDINADPDVLKEFLDINLDYNFPNYTFNVIDNMVAFTFHEKHIQNDSFQYEHSIKDCNYALKFSSLRDKTLYHYTAFIKFPNDYPCKLPSVDIGENNMILYIEMENDRIPNHFYIGLTEHNLRKHLFEEVNIETHSKKERDISEPNVEVTTMGTNEMSISLRKNTKDEIHSDRSKVQQIPKNDSGLYDAAGVCSSNGSFKGILKYKNPLIGRSFSESHVDLFEYNVSPAYSLSSADCIPEESSSVKKTVRFSNIITKQTFRSNSSILGQKSKNQRKKRNKKRAIERRSSEGDPTDSCSLDIDNEDVFTDDGSFKENLNSMNHRRDNSLNDTDDGDSDKEEDDDKGKLKEKKVYKNEKHPSHKHKEPNNGKYQEVNFKNDLIFDLDM